MFTLPPKPPKDYVLKKVGRTQASAPEHTPFGLPRATQTTLGQYCYPVPASDDEPADKSSIVELDDKILNNMVVAMKAWRVDKPGSNAYFLTELHNKYHKESADNDPRYQHKPKIFQRSYKYEFDCMEEARLNKLKLKMAKEEEQEEGKQQEYILKEKAKEKPLIDIVPCKFSPPFWWGEEQSGKMNDYKGGIEVKPSQSTYRTSYPRWQSEPKLFEASQTDLCKKREAFMLCGQNFKHEAISWYNKNYPAPKIKFISEKFAK